MSQLLHAEARKEMVDTQVDKLARGAMPRGATWGSTRVGQEAGGRGRLGKVDESSAL